MMNYKLKYLIFVLILKISSIQAKVQLPDTKNSEISVFLLNDELSSAMLPIKNYASRCSPGGICYGLDRVTHAILTKIKFDASKPMDSEIYDKVKKASTRNEKVTISGFKSARDFLEKMLKTWNEESNPLRRACENIQFSQPINIEPSKKVKKPKNLHNKTFFRAQERALEASLMAGVAQLISIGNSSGRHALTIYGFVKNVSLNNQAGTIFYAFDTNNPERLQPIYIKEEGSEIFWYYPDWEEGLEPHVKLSFIANRNVREEATDSLPIKLKIPILKISEETSEEMGLDILNGVEGEKLKKSNPLIYSHLYRIQSDISLLRNMEKLDLEKLSNKLVLNSELDSSLDFETSLNVIKRIMGVKGLKALEDSQKEKILSQIQTARDFLNLMLDLSDNDKISILNYFETTNPSLREWIELTELSPSISYKAKVYNRVKEYYKSDQKKIKKYLRKIIETLPKINKTIDDNAHNFLLTLGKEADTLFRKIRDFWNLTSLRDQNAIRVIKYRRLYEANTPEEFIKVLKYPFKILDQYDKMRLKSINSETFKYFINKFLTLDPKANIRDMIYVMKYINSRDLQIKFMKIAIETAVVKTPNAFIRLFKWYLKKFDKDEKSRLLSLLRSNIKYFFSLNPSEKEINKLFSILKKLEEKFISKATYKRKGSIQIEDFYPENGSVQLDKPTLSACRKLFTN